MADNYAGQQGADQNEQDGQENEKGIPVSVIEVSVYADGSIEVEIETGAQESAEQSGSGEEAGAAPTYVKDKAEALRVVSSAIDAATQGEQTALQQQQAGYSAP